MWNRQNPISNIAIFFVLLVALTTIGYWLIFRLERASPYMLSAGLAAMCTCLLVGRPIASLGWRWGSWKVHWQNYLVPLLIALSAYLIVWIAGFGGFYDRSFVEELKTDYNLDQWNNVAIFVFHFLISATFSFVVSLPSIIGEEVGWRGFLVPELARLMSFTNVALISGLIWAMFHWPLMFRGIYGSSGTPLVYQIFFFSVGIVAISIVMTYFRYKTNSLWPAVVFHASYNIFFQQVFTPLTLQHENSAWYIDEFGAIPALVSSAAALYFWRKGVNEFSTFEGFEPQH
ncbi:MAG: CPBP family intramembrane glutamic endopeptidase [Gammaproteobacteria bacterium]